MDQWNKGGYSREEFLRMREDALRQMQEMAKKMSQAQPNAPAQPIKSNTAKQVPSVPANPPVPPTQKQVQPHAPAQTFTLADIEPIKQFSNTPRTQASPKIHEPEKSVMAQNEKQEPADDEAQSVWRPLPERIDEIESEAKDGEFAAEEAIAYHPNPPPKPGPYPPPPPPKPGPYPPPPPPKPGPYPPPPPPKPGPYPPPPPPKPGPNPPPHHRYHPDDYMMERTESYGKYHPDAGFEPYTPSIPPQIPYKKRNFWNEEIPKKK